MILILCSVLGVLCSSCSHLTSPRVAAPESVFPNFTIFPSEQSIPSLLIEVLPQRIAALPEGRSLSISRLVERLGLSAYRSNVSANLRANTFFMYLDTDHILYFTMDLDTLPDHMHFQTPWNAKVIECSMLRNPNGTIVSKHLVK